MLHQASSTFQAGKNFLHYHQFGTGKKIILAFHGFGQSGKVFNPVAYAKGSGYTTYSFDLFFHGKSFWHEKEHPLTKDAWHKLLEAFLQEKGIKRFSLAGFSMGAKFALATLEAFPGQVDKVILIAPDGIKLNFWYSLATYPILFRPYFKSLIAKPASFFGLLRVMKKLHLIDQGILRFAASQMSTEEKRSRVYYCWTVFRQLQFPSSGMAKVINANKIPIIVYLGISDKLITKKDVAGLFNHVKDYTLYLLPTGHNTLVEEVARHLKTND